MAKRKGGGREAPIDHTRVIDGFGELVGRTHYESFETECGRCGVTFVFSATAQKHVHEQRGVPIKRARAGAGYCSACATARGRDNRLRAKASAEAQQLRAAAERAKASADASPKDGSKLLEYVVAKIRVLEHSWSQRAAERLLGDVRRARRLTPSLASVSKWELRLGELIAENTRDE
ncbi:hypothetical protein DB30_02806 [Enhygromyxa salina]|uniref:Uncharacterized protein n=1 Tax=Enhygromyxa salina TaxID=215803 RepID=A0A0C2A326_9BACT|nr:hypothetical protein [Enhygromyxa salina]KIG17773.1 hypothetical protein DB30_02806 [Enhygromyxa salina]